MTETLNVEEIRQEVMALPGPPWEAWRAVDCDPAWPGSVYAFRQRPKWDPTSRCWHSPDARSPDGEIPEKIGEVRTAVFPALAKHCCFPVEAPHE